MSLTNPYHSNVLSGKLSSISISDSHQFREAIRNKQNEKKNRLLGYFGSVDLASQGTVLNAVYRQEEDGALSLLRGLLLPQESFHSLTEEFPVFHYFEREIMEQFEVKFPGHPWNKPVRYPSSRRASMGEYPFYRLEGKEIHEVGVGPIHAGVIEPGHFRFACSGETVQYLEVQLGYQHRGVETLLLRGSPARLGPWVETIAGDSSVAHALAYCHAWEQLVGDSGSFEREVARGIALELERIAMHLSGLSGMSTDIAFLPGGATYGRLRTAVINTSMLLCGSRFGRGWIRPHEVRWEINGEILNEVIQTLKSVVHDISLINDHFLSSKSVRHRLQGTGIVKKEAVLDLGFVGMVARSTDVKRDVRQYPGLLYTKLPIQCVIETSGDCWARALLRIREIDASLSWIFKAVETVYWNHGIQKPTVAPFQKEVSSLPLNESFSLSVVEGWRGEIVHYLETDQEGKLSRYRVQDPSIRNWFGLALAVKGNAISDFPICNKSFDLSYCGHDL